MDDRIHDWRAPSANAVIGRAMNAEKIDEKEFKSKAIAVWLALEALMKTIDPKGNHKITY